MKRRYFAKLVSASGLLGWPQLTSGQPPAPSDRTYWLSILDQLSRPVLSHLATNELKTKMPIEAHQPEERRRFGHLEAFGRLMAGIAPWLNLDDIPDKAEASLQKEYLDLANRALANAVDPAAKDFLNFTEGSQPLVDAAFLAHALLRCPRWWTTADTATKTNTVKALLATRQVKPHFNNWLLFSAMIEAFFMRYGFEYDKMRLDYALKQHEQWYMGDGAYGDGPNFHWDYYNSYVIQPFMVDILAVIVEKDPNYQATYDKIIQRAIRFAAVQERLIAPDGSFPVLGRSIVYRAGAFQHLANMALRQLLPPALSPAQVRSALTAVLRKTTGPANYDPQGWLRIGLNGHQPQLAETYICTGSLYLCATALLPLGLAASHPFWAGPSAEWTSVKAWNGTDLPADRAFY